MRIKTRITAFTMCIICYNTATKKHFTKIALQVKNFARHNC